MEIITYSENYRETVNQLMHNIMVDEFGFHQFSNNILACSNLEYLEGNNRLWIATDNNEIIGTIGIIEKNSNHAIIKKLYVKESHRGTGLAKKLLDLCIDYANTLGYDYIYLETYDRLKRANSFYAKHGFEKYHDGYDKPQGDEVQYKLKLK